MPADIRQRVGERIRQLRTKRKLTQEELSGLAGIGQDHLSELERGRKEVGILVLERIVTALEVRLGKFFEDF